MSFKKFVKVYGFCVVVSFIIFNIVLFVFLTFSGLSSGFYRVVLDSNVFCEHYLEFFLLCSGFFCFIVSLNYPFRFGFCLDRSKRRVGVKGK